jgi:hypothetical protein
MSTRESEDELRKLAGYLENQAIQLQNEKEVIDREFNDLNSRS